MSGQNIITQRNAKKHPQYTIEGTTAATYAIIPATQKSPP